MISFCVCVCEGRKQRMKKEKAGEDEKEGRRKVTSTIGHD